MEIKQINVIGPIILLCTLMLEWLAIDESLGIEQLEINLAVLYLTILTLIPLAQAVINKVEDAPFVPPLCFVIIVISDLFLVNLWGDYIGIGLILNLIVAAILAFISYPSPLPKRTKNLFPPILKDCSLRLLINPLTWVLIVIMLLPCFLGLWFYYEFSDERQFEEVDGEKVYYANDGGLLHVELREAFLNLSDLFIVEFIGVLLAIMFSSELINEEFNRKTMQILRTTPIMSLEIIFYRYVTGVLCMFGILASSSIIMYIVIMLGSGIHGIIEELEILWLVIKIVLFESIAYLGIFCLISAYFERPFLLGIVYWIIWEMIVSGTQYQQITVSHYLESILFDGLKNIGLSVTAEDYGLTKIVNNEVVNIATEPITAMLIMIGIGLGTVVWGARGLANRQF